MALLYYFIMVLYFFKYFYYLRVFFVIINKDLITILKETLSKDKRFVAESGELIKAAITSASMQLDQDFISSLLSNEKIKSVFFKEIDNVLVFDKVKFNWVVSNKQF